MPRFTLIIDDATEQQILLRGDKATAARELLERYLYLIAAGRKNLEGRFSGAELSLIADSSNGTIFQAWSVPALWMGVEDSISLDGLDAKWEVDGPALVEKLKSLAPHESFALVDAVERFWQSVSRGEDVQPANLLTTAANPTGKREKKTR